MARKRKRQTGLLAAMLAVSMMSVFEPAGAAQIHRCTDPRNGHISYQDKPCTSEGYSVTQSVEAALPVIQPPSRPSYPPRTESRPEPAPVHGVVPTPLAQPIRIAAIPQLSWAMEFWPGILLLMGVVGGWVMVGRQRRKPRRIEFELPKHPEPAIPPARPTQWSLPLLQSIEWQRFEDLCAAYYRASGMRAETTALGPDGGVDVYLYRGEETQPCAIVQCKARPEQRIGVDKIRELFGVQAAQKVGQSIFITSGSYTDDAMAFAKVNAMTLITGEMLLMLLLYLPAAESQRLLALATEGDYTTPTCPSCGQKMVAKESARGRFWGCRDYPRCCGRLGMRGG